MKLYKRSRKTFRSKDVYIGCNRLLQQDALLTSCGCLVCQLKDGDRALRSSQVMMRVRDNLNASSLRLLVSRTASPWQLVEN